VLGRNVIILGIAQALGASGASLVVLVGGLLGLQLAPTPSLATMPVATLVVGTALSTVPAAFWMKRVGRRLGFIAGALIGAAAALLATSAIGREDFGLLCAATTLVGASLAFVQQYRFAAIESVPVAQAGRAVSTLLLGGIVAGFLGPELAGRTRDLWGRPYAASFLCLAALQVVVAMLLAAMQDTRTAAAADTAEEPRSVARLLRDPAFFLAVAAGVTAYTVMSFVMTATPVSMHALDRHALPDTTRVIQLHVLAMFTPSLFSGYIVDRLGVRRLVMAGAFAMLASIACAVSSHAVLAYGGALMLLGVGWNFLFLGGTVQLTRSYRTAERFRAQATNDFLVFAAQAVASLTAGAVLTAVGWRWVNLAAVPLLVLLLVLFALRAPETTPAEALTSKRMPVPR
jgi:MFS family permease